MFVLAGRLIARFNTTMTIQDVKCSIFENTDSLFIWKVRIAKKTFTSCRSLSNNRISGCLVCYLTSPLKQWLETEDVSALDSPSYSRQAVTWMCPNSKSMGKGPSTSTPLQANSQAGLWSCQVFYAFPMHSQCRRMTVLTQNNLFATKSWKGTDSHQISFCLHNT